METSKTRRCVEKNVKKSTSILPLSSGCNWRSESVPSRRHRFRRRFDVDFSTSKKKSLKKSTSKYRSRYFNAISTFIRRRRSVENTSKYRCQYFNAISTVFRRRSVENVIILRFIFNAFCTIFNIDKVLKILTSKNKTKHWNINVYLKLETFGNVENSSMRWKKTLKISSKSILPLSCQLVAIMEFWTVRKTGSKHHFNCIGIKPEPGHQNTHHQQPCPPGFITLSHKSKQTKQINKQKQNINISPFWIVGAWFKFWLFPGIGVFIPC